MISISILEALDAEKCIIHRIRTLSLQSINDFALALHKAQATSTKLFVTTSKPSYRTTNNAYF